MAIKNLVVLVEDSASCVSRIRFALNLAQTHDAHLTAVYIRSSDLLPSRVAGLVPDAASLSAAMEKAEEDKAAGVSKQFREEADKVGLGNKAHWLYVRGNPDTAAAMVGRYADLVIVGQFATRDQYWPGVNPDEAVFGTGRPLLIVPQEFDPEMPLVSHVVVGWNGTREAARALADSIVLFEPDTKVTAVSVGERPETEKRLGLDIGEHLKRHGIHAATATTPHDGHDAGRDLLAYGRRTGATLLVMGAYGHSRFREDVLGGATRSVLEQMDIPVLMSH